MNKQQDRWSESMTNDIRHNSKVKEESESRKEKREVNE